METKTKKKKPEIKRLLILDKSIAPYVIVVDHNQFTLVDGRGHDIQELKDLEGISVKKFYYTNFGCLLSKLSKLILLEDSKNTLTVEKYMKTFKQTNQYLIQASKDLNITERWKEINQK